MAEFGRDFAVERVAQSVAAHGARKVALQFPDGLIAHACSLADELESRTGATVVVLADTAFGACCIDDTAVAALGVDMLVHFGHTGLVPPHVPRVPVEYIEVDTAAPHEPFVAAAQDVFAVGTRLVLCTTAQFLTATRAACEALCASGRPTRLADAAGTLHEGELLGCTAAHVCASAGACGARPAADAVVYFGDGSFHVEAAAIACEGTPVWRFDPYAASLERIVFDTAGLAARRNAALRDASRARVVGLAVSALGRQAHHGAVRRLRELLDARGVTHFTAVLADLSPESLASFGAVDAWVQVACPRLSLDWSTSYSVPLLTTYEAFLLFGRGTTTDNVPEVAQPYPLDNWASSSHFW